MPDIRPVIRQVHVIWGVDFIFELEGARRVLFGRWGIGQALDKSKLIKECHEWVWMNGAKYSYP